ncbi:MAG: OmpA family protein [Phycisphaerae bacterium]
MRRHQPRRIGLKLVALGLAATGCVARGEYDRVEFARRTAEERATQIEREVADERAQRQAVETERNAIRRELDTKTAMAENLKAEVDRLVEHVDQTKAYADKVLAAGMSAPQVIEITKLPPELDRALKDFAGRYPEAVEYLPDRGMVRWKSDLTFALGKDVVREQAKPSLQEFAQIVNSAAPEFEVVIAGHTDNVPIRASLREHKTNWHLAAHRAIAVMNVLNRNGIPHERMGCMGYGEHRPRVANPPTGGNEKNRRVEIFLVAKARGEAPVG